MMNLCDVLQIPTLPHHQGRALDDEISSTSRALTKEPA